jgi:cytochrome bd-type quinol oxidase subunit 2
MAFDDRRQAAFEYASGATKQLLTLATGIIAVSITFSTDIIANTTAHRWALITAWIVYLGSIVFGIWALLAMTGELEQTQANPPDPSIRGGNVVAPSALQIIAFLVATVFLVLYAGLTFKTKATPSPPTTTVTVTTSG